MVVLVTGSAGFIGFHISKLLLEQGISVVGFDNINNYYDKTLKLARLSELESVSSNSDVFFENIVGDLEDMDALKNVFVKYKPSRVINLAAQAGVRYSLLNPSAHINSNIVGFANILECCRSQMVKHLIFASSSSVYGMNTKLPFKESQNVDHPVSLYAASKKSNELMAHSYSHLYGIPLTGLRFFTVYGPWGRPDMALFLFTKAIIEDKPIEVFNHGNMIRDFTYIDDIAESIFRLLDKPPKPENSFDPSLPDPGYSSAAYRIFNIGNSSPTYLIKYIEAIENELGKKAKKNFLDIQPGDVSVTASDCSALEQWIDFKPSTSIKDGVKKFISWYKEFYKI